MELDKVGRVLVTGASGALGRVLTAHLRGRVSALRLADYVPAPPEFAGDEFVLCDMAVAPAVERLMEGVDVCVHLAAQGLESDWPTVLHSNIIGGINIWEAARKASTRRILFASSNHAIGFWPRTERLDHTAAPKPDSRYGVTKAFGEDLGLYYANKHGIDCFSMRIGSCYPKPVDARMLSTWLSYRDFCHLIEVGLTADYRNEIVYGVSANTRSWWDNANAHRLGFRPQDNAEDFAAEVETRITGTDLDQLFQGGTFISPDFSGDPEKIV
ncbi:MAG: NAD(P)-dependent oxidoreductase [Geminicoccaceae bacterium]